MVISVLNDIDFLLKWPEPCPDSGGECLIVLQISRERWSIRGWKASSLHFDISHMNRFYLYHLFAVFGVVLRDGRVIEEQLLRKIVQRLQGGLVCKAHRPLHHSTLGSRVIQEKKKHRYVEVTIATFTRRRRQANVEQIGQSRPDSGLGLSHFQCKSLQTHVRCSLPARQWIAPKVV